MNQSKYLDSSIQVLKQMLGDQSNELGSEQRRALAKEIRKLKRLQRQPTMSRDEVRRIVNEVALTVLDFAMISAEVKRHS
jgi:hypothetical protein